MSAPSSHDFDAATDNTFGEASASRKLVWYLDYNDQDIRKMRRLLTEAMSRVCQHDAAIAIRPLVRQGHEYSLVVSKALYAASAQGQFVAMHENLLAQSGTVTEETATHLATEIGLDPQTFQQAFHSEKADQVTRNLLSQAQALNVQRKGEIFIDGRVYQGVWDETAMIEAIERPLGFKLQSASHEFFRWPASVGLVLVLATVAALIFVNVGFEQLYHHLLETKAGFSLGELALKLSLEHWVNDGLMAVFFLLVGIEIKREVVRGELSNIRQALLPLIAALGGMIVPATIYALINWGSETVSGWGVPMATDIAFTLGLLALLGKRVPTSLIVFVSALAIADDLGAILVIAVFYGHGFHITPFVGAIIVFAVMLGLNKSRVYHRVPYLALGVLLWYCIYQSGIHATLAGVLTALAIPSRKSGNVTGVAAQARMLFEAELQSADEDEETGALTISAHSHHQLKKAVERLREPGFHLQHAFESWSNYLILPLFAFFNMGILIFGVSFDILAPASLGVILGLAIGKPLGIVSFCWLSTKLGITKLSEDTNWQHIAGAGCLAGVGFTMSIFIASSAFQGTALQSVKLSILIASVVAAVTGIALLMTATAKPASAPTTEA